MDEISSIFTDYPGFRVTVGRLVYDMDGNKSPLLHLDLAALLPVCRTAKGQGETVLNCAGKPYVSIENPPFLDPLDWQICHGKKRVKVGYGWADSDERGLMYQIRIEPEAILEEWDAVWTHGHYPTPEEIEARTDTNKEDGA